MQAVARDSRKFKKPIRCSETDGDDVNTSRASEEFRRKQLIDVLTTLHPNSLFPKKVRSIWEAYHL